MVARALPTVDVHYGLCKFRQLRVSYTEQPDTVVTITMTIHYRVSRTWGQARCNADDEEWKPEVVC